MASRLGLSVRDTPASAVANRNDIERHGAQNFEDAANTLPGNASAPPVALAGRLPPWFHQQPDHPDVHGINVSAASPDRWMRGSMTESNWWAARRR
jgi:hypothetical protein